LRSTSLAPSKASELVLRRRESACLECACRLPKEHCLPKKYTEKEQIPEILGFVLSQGYLGQTGPAEDIQIFGTNYRIESLFPVTPSELNELNYDSYIRILHYLDGRLVSEIDKLLASHKDHHLRGLVVELIREITRAAGQQVNVEPERVKSTDRPFFHELDVGAFVHLGNRYHYTGHGPRLQSVWIFTISIPRMDNLTHGLVDNVFGMPLSLIPEEPRLTHAERLSLAKSFHLIPIEGLVQRLFDTERPKEALELVNKILSTGANTLATRLAIEADVLLGFGAHNERVISINRTTLQVEIGPPT